ncbi:MAG: class I adenylate-forming enzyme family protein [Halanaeroarchaeum sp.]
MRDVLAVRTAATPDRVGLVDAATGRSFTFRDLHERTDALAGALAAVGVEAGDRVALLLENRPAVVTALWASQRLGAALVPLNVRQTAAELSPQWDRVDPAVVLTESGHAATATDVAGDAPVLSVDGGDDADRPLDAVDPAPVHPEETMPGDELIVMFTSGTTGDPKAVCLLVRNVLASAVASAFRLGVVPGDEWLDPLPTFHMGGLSVPIRTTLYGTTTLLAREFDASAVARAIAERDVTGVSLVPTMLDRLLDAGLSGSGLRFALVGGGAADADLLERALDAGVPVHPTYGMTETASQITTATPTDLRSAVETVGRPLVGAELAILDEAGDRVDRGERGEIAVRGPTVSPGYVGESPRDGAWFGTGDRGFRDDAGRLFVTGRADDLILTGGENVAPDEVREAILAHPSVEDAVVLGVPDEEWGERVAALVVGAIDGETLEAFLADRLADYKRPRTVAIVSDLPRTPSGTIDREAARRRLQRESGGRRDDDA